MSNATFDRLHAEGLISAESLEKVNAAEKDRLFSLYWELRLLLYLGILLLTGGLGILVYKNIDTIGHQAILAFIALVSAGCFAWCIRKKQPFSWNKVQAPDSFFDYILLLGCLSLLIFLGYWQFAYNIFGNNYGLATFIPMVILFLTAYVFDHMGVLGLAITNLAAWAGVSITPMTILHEGNFAETRLIYTGILLGILLLLAGQLSKHRQYKAHFWITYTNFGFHMFFIAALAGLFQFDNIYLGWFLALALIATYLAFQAIAMRSFYFFLMSVLYVYIGLSYVVIHLLETTDWRDMTPIVLGLFYFIFSAIGIAVLLVRINRKFKTHDSL